MLDVATGGDNNWKTVLPLVHQIDSSTYSYGQIVGLFENFPSL
jgi:hypothetical protein